MYASLLKAPCVTGLKDRMPNSVIREGCDMKDDIVTRIERRKKERMLAD